MKKELDTQQKAFEQCYTYQRLLPGAPACARIDGRAFHSFCRGLDKPWDTRLSSMMIRTAKFLVEETNATIGYTQSDEISLLWYSRNIKSKIFFDGRVHKMVSTLAALASVYFNELLTNELPAKCFMRPTFDARVWNVPDTAAAVDYLRWREADATRNSVLMLAQSMFSHGEMQGKSCAQLHAALHQRNVNWADCATHFKRGTYVQRKHEMRTFTTEELGRLPPKHMAHTNPDLQMLRSIVTVRELPPIASIENAVDVVFYGREPRKKD